MKRFGSFALALVVTALYAAAAVAQSRPSFAGTWVVDRDKTIARMGASGGGGVRSGGGGGGGSMSAVGGGGGSMVGVGAAGTGAAPAEVTVTQTAAALTYERTTASGPQKFVYKLDGSESVNVNGRSTLKTKSRWEGSTLVTEGTQSTASDQGAISGTFKETRSLDKDGSMIVETVRVYEGAPSTATGVQVYVKKQ